MPLPEQDLQPPIHEVRNTRARHRFDLATCSVGQQESKKEKERNDGNAEKTSWIHSD